MTSTNDIIISLFPSLVHARGLLPKYILKQRSYTNLVSQDQK